MNSIFLSMVRSPWAPGMVCYWIKRIEIVEIDSNILISNAYRSPANWQRLSRKDNVCRENALKQGNTQLGGSWGSWGLCDPPFCEPFLSKQLKTGEYPYYDTACVALQWEVLATPLEGLSLQTKIRFFFLFKLSTTYLRRFWNFLGFSSINDPHHTCLSSRFSRTWKANTNFGGGGDAWATSSGLNFRKKNLHLRSLSRVNPFDLW